MGYKQQIARFFASNGEIKKQALRGASDDEIRVEGAIRDPKSLKPKSIQIEKNSTLFKVKTLKDWQGAIALATDPHDPTFVDLSELYENLKLDNHFSATVDNRIYKVLRSKFMIKTTSGDENPDLKVLFESPWFEEFIKYALWSKFSGVKVLEIAEVDQNLELIKVTNIPMGHLKTSKGLITKLEGDETGWPYKEGALERFYIQVGEDNELGVLADIAPMIIAKKLAFGSWLDFIQKFGIPPRWVITDKESPKRVQELMDMMMDMVSNHVAVLTGNETIEIGKTPGTDAHQVFNQLISRINSEISKQILGQDGTSDHKEASGTYGSLKVLQDVANDRHESDKLFIKNLINKELIPRLLKLSSFYSSLAGHTFDWDNSEQMTTNEFIENVVSLSGAGFKLDKDQIQERTGITIIDDRDADPDPTPPKDPKKKKSIVNAVHQLYLLSDHKCGPDHQVTAVRLPNVEKIMDRIARAIFKGSLKPFSLDKELVRYTYNQLEKGAKAGYGKDWINYETANSRTVRELKKNLYRFSGAKTYHQLKEINELLVDSKGNIRSFNEFKKAVLTLSDTYNKNYLRTEYNTAVATAQNARKWEEILETKDLYPNLVYRTVGDSKVRDEHAVLDKLIKPIEDPFWDTHYPPNGWNCRCYVQPSRDPVTKENVKLEVEESFKNHVGKTGQIFSEKKHPYFAIPKKDRNLTQQSIDNMLASVSGMMVREYARQYLIGEKYKISGIQDPIVLTNKNVKGIVSKAHEDRVGRNELLYELKDILKKAVFVKSVKELKNRAKYIEWFYYKVDSKQGNYYLNIVLTAEGNYRLHAITDKLK